MAQQMLSMELKSTLKGHNGWVSALATSSQNAELLVSGGRDKTLMMWKVDTTNDVQPEEIQPVKSLHGHSHFIQDVCLDNEANFALTASWDGTVRLWDLNKKECVRRFVGHTKDVMSVAISSDASKIITASRDKTIKLWNTLGKCKSTIDAHDEWVSCVRFVPGKSNKFVSAGWDNLAKTWTLDQTMKLESTIQHHTGFINTVAFSPDGSIMATSGKDGRIAFWSLNNSTGLYEFLYDVVLNTQVYQIAFAEDPTNYSVIAATDAGIFIIKEKEVVCAVKTPAAVSVTMSATKDVVFTGHTDNMIRMWKVSIASSKVADQ